MADSGHQCMPGLDAMQCLLSTQSRHPDDTGHRVWCCDKVLFDWWPVCEFFWYSRKQSVAVDVRER